MYEIKILLVEDDEFAAEVIYDFLSSCSFLVDTVFTATDGMSYIEQNEYDVVLLDINLPDYSGFDVLRNIKKNTSLPIIITSAFSDTQSKVMAFKYGASDYMTKPLDLEELEARIWVQLGKNSDIKMQSDYIFKIDHSQIFFHNKALNLTKIEFEIMSILIKNQNRTVSRDELTSSLSSVGSHRSLDNHIKNIRKKLETIDTTINYLKTEYGIGYKLQIN
jgi:DNA-binding response OmpR family regulator